MGKFGHQTFTRIRLKGGTGSYILAPVLTETQRDALTAAEGMVIFNSTTDQLEEYDGSTWQAIGQVIMTTHEADLDAHTKDLRELMRTGEYVGNCLRADTSGGSTAILDEYLCAIPFLVARDITVDRIAIDVQTGEVNADARLGIYNNGTNLYPGTLLLDAGAVDLDTASVKAITIDPAQSLTKGLYWLVIAFNSPGGTGKLYRITSGMLQLGINATNFAVHYGCYIKSGITYAALADPFPSGASLNQSYQWQIALRIASLA